MQKSVKLGQCPTRQGEKTMTEQETIERMLELAKISDSIFETVLKMRRTLSREARREYGNRRSNGE